MSGYDSTGASTVNGGNGYANSSAAQQGSSGTGQKRRRANADPDFYPGAAPTTKRAQANWRAAQEQAARQNSLQQLSQQQQQQQQQQLQQQQQQMEPRQPILSLASLPPEALQRYLSRYGLIDPQGLLSYHHAVFPVPALPETLHPPLDGRQLNVRKAKMTYIPAARNAKILAARAAAAAATGGEGGDEATTANTSSDDGGPVTNNSGQAGDGAADAAMTTAAAAAAASGSADPPATDDAAVAASSAPGSRLTPQARSWLEPKTADFASLSAFDHPDVVLQRLAARATQHWDKRESLKEAETLTNFMFSVRNRGRTLRATPAG